jgi:hypothetical protein
MVNIYTVAKRYIFAGLLTIPIAVPMAQAADSFIPPPGLTVDVGDGYDVLFDNKGHIFTIHHKVESPIYEDPTNNDYSIGAAECHNRDGTNCGPGWPFDWNTQPNNYGRMITTGRRASGWVDNVNKRIWYAAGAFITPVDQGADASKYESGFGCIDISDITQPKNCMDNNFKHFVSVHDIPAPNPVDMNDPVSLPVEAGGKIYTLEMASARLLCLDTTTSAPCAGQSVFETKPSGATGGTVGSIVINTGVTEPYAAGYNGRIWQGGLKKSNGLIYGIAAETGVEYSSIDVNDFDTTGAPSSTKIYGFCFNPTTSSWCTGGAMVNSGVRLV